MFEKAPHSHEHATPQVHELRVAVFDLSQRALASASFSAPSLVIDRQTLNSDGLPGVSSEQRAVHVGSRNLLGLPPVDVIGRIHPGDEQVHAYAVATREPVDFRRFTMKRFELDEVFELAHEQIHNGREALMDRVDAQLILASLALKPLRDQLKRRHHLV